MKSPSFQALQYGIGTGCCLANLPKLTLPVGGKVRFAMLSSPHQLHRFAMFHITKAQIGKSPRPHHQRVALPTCQFNIHHVDYPIFLLLEPNLILSYMWPQLSSCKALYEPRIWQLLRSPSLLSFS